VTTLLFRCRVGDFDTWLPQYEAAVRVTPEVTSYRVWHGQDDPNEVVIIETFESREVAERLLNSPEMQEEMASHDVDLSSIQVAWLDEAAASA
jgi:quinol monooxygenase YgiN